MNLRSMSQIFRATVRVTGSLFLLVAPVVASAHFTIFETGEILKPKQYLISGIGQYLTGPKDGLNLAGRGSMSLTDSVQIGAEVGLGSIDFEAAASIKYIPFPDIDNQPAIGVYSSVYYSRFYGMNDVGLRISPLVSKRFDLEGGHFLTPYGATPISFSNRGGESITPIHLVGGATYENSKLDRYTFSIEMGLNVQNAFNYIAGSFNFLMDDPSK